MKLMTCLTTTSILLVAANPACAKHRVKIDVEVSDDKIKNTVQDSIKARLSSTERYTITDSDEAMELHMEVNCLVLENDAGIKNGIVCSSEADYYPYHGSPVSIRLETAGHMAVSGIRESSFLIEKLTDHFLNATTDSELVARKTFLRNSVQLLCSHYPNECKVPASKQIP